MGKLKNNLLMPIVSTWAMLTNETEWPIAIQLITEPGSEPV
jgi:hypothetical protein